MAIAWPEGVPFRILEGGAAHDPGDPVIGSKMDSGRRRQRKAQTASREEFSGVIPMTWAQKEAFIAWRNDDVAGAVIDWPGYPGGAVEARFVGGEQGVPSKDGRRAGKWLVPVKIEVLP